MHIGALAVALKVPVRKLEALEIGELASLSGPVFVRALASSVCRHIKMDPTETVHYFLRWCRFHFLNHQNLRLHFGCRVRVQDSQQHRNI